MSCNNKEFKWPKTLSLTEEATDKQVAEVDSKARRTDRTETALTAIRSEGMLMQTDFCRPFKPRGGFKKDRQEGQKPLKQQQGGAKHIDLKALRKNEDPIRIEKAQRQDGQSK